MKFRLTRTTAVAAICAMAGATAGIAGVAAAPSKNSSSASKSAKSKKSSSKDTARNRAQRRGGPGGPRIAFRGPGIHSEMVVPNQDGTGFDTVIMDSGRVESVEGNTITVKQGTDKATWKTQAIDVGAEAKVVRNHDDAKVSDIKAGDHVHIVRGPRGNSVHAVDEATRKAMEERRAQFGGRHRHAPGGPGGPPGPAPAPPAGP
jgi:hypothetical protein